MARYVLLLNRGSGGNDRGLDAHEVVATVEEIFREAGHDIHSMLLSPGALDAALRDAIAAAPDGVIVAGGDGTVSAAARHLRGGPIALGILPMGTFNLAARDLGIPLEMEEAARFLAKAKPLPIDVLDVGGHSCLCTTILGFYPQFARTFERRDHGGRWWKKTLRLITGLPRFFSEARPIPLSWQGDEKGSARTKFSAFVPGRSLYLKMKLFLKRHSATRSYVSRKSSSVSPQKPTIKSLVTAACGSVSRIRPIISR